MIYSIILITFIILTLFTLYVFKRRKKYTRERFIFVSTLLVFSFAGIVLTHIFADKSLIQMLLEAYNLLPFESIPIQATSWSDKAWSVLILLILISFIIVLVSTWEGAQSIDDRKLSEQKRDVNVFKSFIKGNPLNKIDIYKEEALSKKSIQQKMLLLDEKHDWHTEVRDILTMTSRQYKIIDDDWHSTENVYISKYSDKTIAIICELKDLSEDEIKRKLRFIEQLTNKTLYEVKILIKNFIHTSKKVDMNNPSFNYSYQYKDEILNAMVNFDDYFDYIKQQFHENEISPGDDITLDEVYVPSMGNIFSFKKNKECTPIDNVEDYLLKWVKESKCQKQISLLGEYGQGKSVLSLKIAYEMIQKEYKRIPIIIELRGKSPRNETLSSIISSWAIRFHIDPLAIQTLLQEGKLLVVLEGFDELDMIGDSNRRLEHFKRLWEFARYKKSKVIITGRPNLFLDNEELVNYLHIDNNGYDLFYSEAIHLLPFNLDQIRQGLVNTDKHIREEIIGVLSDSETNSSFLDLLSRPSTLYQASIIWDYLDKENINSATVVQEFINHAYRRQEEKLGTLGKTGFEPPVLTGKEREYFMIGVAVGMIKLNGYSNQINKQDLEKIIARLYFEIPEHLSNDHVDSKDLKTRMKDNSNYLESIFNDVRTSGILVRDLTKNDSFKFAHKSFLEYLFAYFFVELQSQNNKSVNDIRKAHEIENITSLDFSKEVISFSSTMILHNLNLDNISDEQTTCQKLIDEIDPKIRLTDNIFYKKRLSVFSYYDFFRIIFVIVVTIVIVLTLMSKGSISPFVIVASLGQVVIASFMTFDIFKRIMTKRTKNSFLIWEKTCDSLTMKDKVPMIISTKLIDIYQSEELPSEYFFHITRLLISKYLMK